MLMFKTLLMPLLIMALMLLAGCSSSSYIPPQSQIIITETTTATDHQTVWHGLVKKLSTSGVTVIKLNSDNNIMKMMLDTAIAETYVDCGSQLIISDENQTQTNVNPIQSIKYSLLENEQILEVVRQSGLQAYITIQVTAVDQVTRVNVDVRYAIFGKNKIYNSNKHLRNSEKIDYQLSSKKAFSGDKISCVSKGIIENKIIEAVL